MYELQCGVFPMHSVGLQALADAIKVLLSQHVLTAKSCRQGCYHCSAGHMQYICRAVAWLVLMLKQPLVCFAGA